MKTSSMLTLPFLLLFAFLINLPLLAFSDDDQPVLDTEDKPVYSDGQYYIVPTKGPGGGLRLGRTGTSRCPVTVLQDDYEGIFGVPVQFKPEENLKIHEIIDTGTHLAINFSNKQVPECASSSKWWMFNDRYLDEKTIFMGIGSANDNPDITKEADYDGYFTIKKSVNGYKLVFCKPDPCQDLGLYDKDEDGRRLILPTEKAIEVSFVNAKEFELMQSKYVVVK